MNADSPQAVVQRQLDAYNARDLEAWVATYAPHACQYELPAKLLASGTDAMRARMAIRFAEPNLHARLVSRTVMGALVVDHEVVTRTFPEGPGSVEVLAVYEVRAGLIVSASFAFGEPRLGEPLPGPR